MNVEQVVKAGLKIKEKGLVVTGSSLKEHLKDCDPKTLITVWLKNNPREKFEANISSLTVNNLTSSVRYEDLYNKIIHDICEDSSEIIYHLENKIKTMEDKLSEVSCKLKGTERELHQNKKTLSALDSIVNTFYKNNALKNKKASELNQLIENEISSIKHSNKNSNKHSSDLSQSGSNQKVSGLSSQTKNDNTKKHNFSSQAMSELSPSDQILFEQFGQGPTELVHYGAIHQAFEMYAAAQPDAIAAKHLDEAITYQTPALSR